MRGMIRPGITAKLFIAFMSVTLIAVMAVVLSTRYTFQEDFLEYARERQEERLETLAERLADYYGQSRSWADLRGIEDWHEFLEGSMWRYQQFDGEGFGPGARGEHGGHEEDNHDGDDDGRRGSPGPVPTLLNIGGRRIVGPELASIPMDRIAVRVDGATVGWLAYRPVEQITDQLALRFQREQFEAAWITAGAVAALAAIVSLLLARGFLAPVGRLTRATHALTAGRFDTHVEESRRDELGQLARDFNRLAETLERNERLRREFMADMSHELRTPLSVLRGELEAMEDGVRPLTREALAGLQRNLAELSKLVDDLYELSLADAGALTYRMGKLDLASLSNDLVEDWRARFEAAHLALTAESPERDIAIRGDQERLRQLLGNLLRNSLYYTDAEGKVHVRVGIEEGNAVVRVEDSAPGVTASERVRLFERLYRVEGSRSRASGGAGLGLAICERIARAHDGHLEAYASPLGGLGIRLQLPLAEQTR